jgi:DNA polymerase-3 subunit delta'
MFTGIYGHKKQIEFLGKSIESGSLSHAYIFSGPSFVGKKTVAREFAKNLLESGPGNFHPDFLEVTNDEAIKIDQVRELIYKLSLRPYSAKYKVALIDNAETMTVEAQNALLKVLEEPKSYTIIILVTSNTGKLLRTISSRAQKINFGPVLAF